MFNCVYKMSWLRSACLQLALLRSSSGWATLQFWSNYFWGKSAAPFSHNAAVHLLDDLCVCVCIPFNCITLCREVLLFLGERIYIMALSLTLARHAVVKEGPRCTAYRKNVKTFPWKLFISPSWKGVIASFQSFSSCVLERLNNVGHGTDPFGTEQQKAGCFFLVFMIGESNFQTWKSHRFLSWISQCWPKGIAELLRGSISLISCAPPPNIWG